INSSRHLRFGLEAFVIAVDSVFGIRKPDAAVGMHHDVVWRVQSLALIFLSDDGDSSIRLVSHNPTPALLTPQLTSFEVTCVPVAVARWVSEYCHAAVFFDPAHLDIVRYIAPDEVSSDSIPCRTFRPESAEMKPPDNRIANNVPAEPIIEG